MKKESKAGICQKCWNRAKGKLCKRGLAQDDNKKACRWYSGVK